MDKFARAEKLLEKADKLFNSNKLQKAIKNINEAMKIFEDLPAPFMVAVCNVKLGNIYEFMGDFKSALPLYEHSLALRKGKAPAEDIADSYRFLARINYRLKNFDKSFEYAKAAYETLFNDISKKNREQNGGTNRPKILIKGGKKGLIAADSYYYLGSIHYLKHNYNTALFYFFHAIQFINQQEQPRLYIQLHQNLAKTYQQLGNYSASTTMFLKVIQYYHILKNYTVVMVCLDNAALNCSYTGEKDKAFKYITDAEEIFKMVKKGDNDTFLSLNSSSGKSSALVEHGGSDSARGNEGAIIWPVTPVYWEHYYTAAYTYLLMGEFDKAEEYCENAMEVAELYEMEEDLIQSLYLMARIMITTFSGDEEELHLIENYLNEALDRSKKLDDLYYAAEYYEEMALLYKNTPYEEKIPELLEEGLEMLEASKYEMQKGKLLLEYGLYYHSQKRFENALEMFKRALDKFQSSGHLELTAKTNYNLACVSSVLHYGEETLEYLRAAISINPKYKLLARDDEDFHGIKSDPAFKQIIE